MVPDEVSFDCTEEIIDRLAGVSMGTNCKFDPDRFGVGSCVLLSSSSLFPSAFSFSWFSLSLVLYIY